MRRCQGDTMATYHVFGETSSNLVGITNLFEIMKVYVVTQGRGTYEDYVNKILKVFKKKKDAEEFKAERDKLCFDDIPEKEIWKHVDQDAFFNWPYVGEYLPDGSENPVFVWDEATEFAPEFKGYTLEQFKKQEEVYNILYQEYHKAHISEYELE